VRCSFGSCVVSRSVTRYGPTKTTSATIAVKTPAPGIHHHEPNQRASAITTSSAMQTATKDPPSASQPPKAHSK
jgi:hypothetical protein